MVVSSPEKLSREVWDRQKMAYPSGLLHPPTPLKGGLRSLIYNYVRFLNDITRLDNYSFLKSKTINLLVISKVLYCSLSDS